MDMCGKNQDKILRLQFQKRLNNKKVIWEISDLLENCVWFSHIISTFAQFCELNDFLMKVVHFPKRHNSLNSKLLTFVT